MITTAQGGAHSAVRGSRHPPLSVAVAFVGATGADSRTCD
jgi:hypothetical protein